MYYEELAASRGEVFTSRRRTITETDGVNFTSYTGIMDPVFTDEIFAQENLFGGRVVPGPMIMTYALGLTDDLGYGTVLAALAIDEARFVSPVKPGDTIHVLSEITETRESTKYPHAGIVTIAHDVKNQDGTTVQTFSRTLMVLKKPAPRGDA